AEDGIRDFHVTGVQTCALPILPRTPDEEIPPDEPLYRSISAADVIGPDVQPGAVDLPRCSFNRGKYSAPEAVIVERRPQDNGIRSEERRVGKERGRRGRRCRIR